ncbi:MAG: ABC transporter permease [Defluviitaleaceae bacterium]|nr:ABC transporter permease [Defluviitaleaceae bacterium]
MSEEMVTRFKSFNYKQFLIDNSAFVTLILLIIVATVIMGGTFFNAGNFVNILFNNAIIGIIALGMTLIIISGGIDLSVGSAAAFIGLITITVINHTGSIILGVLSAFASGILMGAFNGVLAAKFRIPAFIVTLGSMQIFRSLSLHFWNGGGVLLGRIGGTPVEHDVLGYRTFATTRIFEGILPNGLPLPVLYWIALTILIAIFCKKTALGRHIYAIGSNERAANLSAVKVTRVKILVYMIAGALVAFAAMVESSRLGSMNSATSGTLYELQAIAAVVIGGTAMNGGRGRPIGTFFGTLTLGVINNLMNMMGIPSFLVGAIQGSIVIIAVLFQMTMTSKERQF